jgi:predicted homoserine dehydrogenase-like protein
MNTTTDTVRDGIIGVGNMGSAHARNIQAGKVPGLRLTAVADIGAKHLELSSPNLIL